MIQFENLSIRGFSSISELDINLNQRGITLIRGANGEGKSTALSAITWCLFGKNLKGVSDVNTWSKYRTKDYQGTMVSLTFRVKGTIYKIIRCLNYKETIEGAKGGNRLVIIKDAELLEIKKKVDQQKSISNILGMSYGLFMSSIMFGQGMTRVIQNSNNDQKNLFSEIFNLQYITNAQTLAKSQYTKKHEEYQKVNIKYDKLCSSLNLINRNIKISKEGVRDFDDKLKSKLKVYKQGIELLSEKLEKLNKVTITDTSNKDSLETKLSKYKSQYRDLKNEVENLSLSEVLDKVLKLLKNKKVIKAIKSIKDIQDKYGKISKLQNQISETHEQLNELYSSDRRNQNTLREIKSIKSQIDSKKETIKDLRNTKPPLMDKSLKNQAIKLKSQIEELKEILDSKAEEVEVYKWVYTNPLGPNGMKAYIFNNSIQKLNEILKTYSNILGIHISFLIDTDSVRKEFETVIQLDGITVLFEELSGGQKQLVHLAMALAMNQLVTEHHQVNVAFMDELFESLSYDNIEIVVELIKKVYKEKNLFVITHHDSLPLGNVRTINVSKNKGLSQYKF